ncbi:cytochrome c3 family protein [Noviherbaspirillum denitrificans]|uniref:cytochrome c3 family protein n=1 Tax=Noviherbaspirillum denitrificans TaxID=1968433 RepID=UPI001F1AEC0F|nr:cytochrome c3 family protein [Noviherbaspirillum denitrificans]
MTNKIADVRGTKHNFSAASDGSATPSGGTVPERTIKASSETQVCVFCHTPHAAEAVVTPLWNRKLSGQTYATYTSSSMEASDAEMAAAPGGSSKLCLSCHDGTMGVDKVNVLNGVKNATIAMASGTKISSDAATTGFTRNLGTDLKSDHPISFTYDAALATADGELRAPDGIAVGNRTAGAVPPKMPLEKGKMECSTCHDPHLRDKTTSNGNAKFLRVNRFQVAPPTGGNFSTTNDIICLACHDKGGVSYAFSAHANSQVATQIYKPAAAKQREFPSSLDSPANTEPPVWQISCLNCHDSHTVQGARRLLREATDSTTSPKTGGNASLEETCYQCHTNSAGSVVSYTALTSSAIPDIKTDFTTSARHMPIKSSEQAAGVEVHDIAGIFNDATNADCSKTTGKCGKDFLESRAKLGLDNLNNRHAECTDCHNPHRVVKFRDFRGNPAGSITGTPDAAGTHKHTEDGTTLHSNIASGVLRGSWGVEPEYVSASFHVLPSGYTVKRGDPGTNSSSLVTASYVTREYQICLKCHSDYGYTDNNLYPNGSRPKLGASGTPAGTNGLTIYTNQAKEFQAPVAHQNEPLNLGTAAGTADANFNNNNHRSWHPVMAGTGRTPEKRNMTGGAPWLPPWNTQVGESTMYCSDCHGSGTTSATSVIPNNGDNGNVWGPHGSNNDFLLKGTWTDVKASTANILCFKCHAKANYSSGGGWGGGSGNTTGFSGSWSGNLHNYHANKVGDLRCTWCHVAVPHGWRNKALLVNLNDVGEEAGQGVGSSKEVSIAGSNDYYSQEPYYYKARNKIASFAASGNWSASNCGSKNKSGTGLTTGRINSTNGQTSNASGTGRSWMRSTCDNPP